MCIVCFVPQLSHSRPTVYKKKDEKSMRNHRMHVMISDENHKEVRILAQELSVIHGRSPERTFSMALNSIISDYKRLKRSHKKAVASSSSSKDGETTDE